MSGAARLVAEPLALLAHRNDPVAFRQAIQEVVFDLIRGHDLSRLGVSAAPPPFAGLEVPQDAANVDAHMDGLADLAHGRSRVMVQRMDIFRLETAGVA